MSKHVIQKLFIHVRRQVSYNYAISLKERTLETYIISKFRHTMLFRHAMTLIRGVVEGGDVGDRRSPKEYPGGTAFP